MWLVAALDARRARELPISRMPASEVTLTIEPLDSRSAGIAATVRAQAPKTLTAKTSLPDLERGRLQILRAG